MTLKINGATGGSVSLDAPDNTSPAGTDVTLTLPVNDGDAGQYLQTDGTGALSWQTVAGLPDAIDVNASAPADSLNIDANGRLLAGTTTARTNVDFYGTAITPSLQYEGTTNDTSTLSLIANSTTDSVSGQLRFGKSSASGIGNNGAVVNNEVLGRVNFSGSNGTSFFGAAEILSCCDGNPSTRVPGRLQFYTATNTTDPAERMRIDGNGYLTLWKNSSSNESRFQFNGNSTRIAYNDSSGHLTFYTNSAARVRCNYLGGFLPVTDNSMTLGTTSERWSVVYAALGTIQTSDLREKTNIATSSLGTDFIKQLRPVSYKFKVGQNDVTVDEETGEEIVTPRPGIRTHWGFVAQEVKEAVDAAGVDFGGWILTDKDDPDSEQGLRYDQFIAPLTKALQEAIAKIETLETANASQAATIAALDARLTALEGGAA